MATTVYSHIYTWSIQKHTYTYAQKNHLWLSKRKELTARLLLHRGCYKDRALRAICVMQ